MTIKPDQVRHNGMTENLGTDVVAVDAQGNVLGRADTRDAAERASPDAVAFFTAKDFEGAPASATPASADHNDAFDKILAQVDPAVLKDYLPAEPDAPEAKAAEPEAKAAEPEAKAAEPPAAEDAVIVAEGERPEAVDPVKITSTTDAPPDTELAEAKAQIAKMDSDGDGKIGGAPKGGNRQRKPKA